MAAVTIPVMAKARIGHFAEAQIMQALGVDMVDESEGQPLIQIMQALGVDMVDESEGQPLIQIMQAFGVDMMDEFEG